MRLSTFLTCLLFVFSFRVFAEGTKELTPKSGDQGSVQIFDNNSTSRPFATFDCPEEHRLNFTICNLGEKVFFGFRQNDNDVYFRIKDPNGNLVPINGNTINRIPNSGQGYISNYNRAVAGPSQIVGNAGYNALSFTPAMTGDYYIEFNPKRSNWAADVVWPQKRVFTYFDITVATANNVAIPGRLWSKAWDLQCNGANNPFNGKMYIYADDGIVTSLDFNGMQPHGFVIFANSSGLHSTGDANADRQSQHGNINYPQYKIFLNNPDESCFHTGTFGKLTQPSNVTGCSKDNYCINVYTDRGGTIEVLLDLQAPAGFQENTRDRLLLVKDAKVGHNCIPWNGKDGKGNEVPMGTTIDFEVNYFNGLTHLPLYDVENHRNGYIVELVRPAGPKPVLYWDDSKVGGGSNLTGCTNPSGCHTWTNNFGDVKTLNTWWHAATIKEKLNFSLNFIEADAWVGNGFGNQSGAGNGKANDTTVCGSIKVIQLDAAVVNAGGGIWSTSGTGTFSDNTDLKGTYTLSDQDILNGGVTLTLTTTGNGNCPPITDDLTVTINRPPSVSANNVSVCSNNPTVSLTGSVTNSSGAIWSGGNGSFSNATSVNTTYTPTAAEIANGSVQLKLTSLPNGGCPPAETNVTVSFTPEPEINLQSPVSLCKNSPVANLTASVTNATGGTWSGGNGNFSNPNSLNTTYSPTPAEINNNTVTLKFTTTGNGTCNPVSRDVVLNFTPSPQVEAGPDQNLCANNAVANLSGTVTGAGAGVWSGGAGAFSQPNNINTTYTPHASEIQSGSVKLYLTSSDNGTCQAVKDSLIINYTPAPTVNAGSDLFVCGNNPTVTLQGQISNASQASWSGMGTFSNPNSLTTLYTPHPAEISSSVASLILSSTDNGNCLPARDTVVIIIAPAPVTNAGPDQSLCKNNAEVILNGSVSNATNMFWSGGEGSFSSITAPNPVYIPSDNELNVGSVTLTLTATKPSCNNVSDEITIQFTDIPVANAGPDKSVCSNNPSIQLNGSVLLAGGGIWSTTGNGTFEGGNNGLNSVFTPTATQVHSGSIEFILTSTDNGNCLQVEDTMKVTFTPSPTVYAGQDQQVCSNKPEIQLSGSVTRAGGAVWSGGQGSFSPGPTSLNAIYYPSPAEVASGSIQLILTSTNNGDCLPVSDSVVISFTPAPVASPGNPITVCADAPMVKLNGSVTVANGGIWSGGNGSFADANNLETTYTPTPQEIAQGSVVLTLTSTENGNCNSVSADVAVTIVPAPVISAGSDQTVCGSVNTVDLSGNVQHAGGGVWSVISGSGSISNSGFYNATYHPTNQDRLNGAVNLKFTSTGNGTCKPVSDSMVITFTVVPTINAGPDKTVCTNDFPVALEGSGSPAVWQGGQGTFLPDRETLNATYIPAASEFGNDIQLTLTTKPNGACPVISDVVSISIPLAPAVNAGPDQQICGNLNTINLSGTVNNAPGAVWSHNGKGTLGNSTSLNTSYTITDEDKESGSVMFILRSTGNLICSSVSDTMIANITPAISVNAGPDKSVCADFSEIILNGSIKNTSGATWTSSGSGNFINAQDLAATYVPSAADKNLSGIVFTLTTNSAGVCDPVIDQVEYTITPAPTVDGGNDMEICADSSFVQVSATFTIAQGVTWTSSGSGVFNAVDNYSANYLPSEEDRNNGTLYLIATTTGNGLCKPVKDTVKLNITPSVTTDAGIDQTLCADAGIIKLDGNITVATGGTWTSSGTGTFTDPNSVSTDYILSSQDSTNQIVTLTLSSTGNGTCKPASDQVVISLTPAPEIEAGEAQTICANTPSVKVTAMVKVASGAVWSSSGSGTFSSSGLSATYIPGQQDTLNGFVYLIASTTGNGDCKVKKDSVLINFDPVPVADAGNPVSICADSSYIKIEGKVKHALSGIWSGSGTFAPKSDTLATTYFPTGAERTAGKAVLVLSTEGNGTCLSATDTLIVTITPEPTADAGTDFSVCADTSYIQLDGAVTVATGGLWQSSGDGSFNDPQNLNGSYIPGPADIGAGKVVLTLTTTGNGLCKSKSSSKTITINPAPQADAGPDLTLCADVPSISLTGKVQNAQGGKWLSLGSGNSFQPSELDLNTSYVPSQADTSAGFVNLVLVTTGNGLCKPVSDSVKITLLPQPVVRAGQDQTICADFTATNISGIVKHAGAFKWSTTGSGYFSPSASILSPSYVPGQADKTAGWVNLILTTTEMGTCMPVSDTLRINILPAPVVSAGDDQTICADFEEVQLSGSVTHAGGGKWASSGTGLFIPSDSSVTASYVPSLKDITDGNVVLTLTSIKDSVCTSVSDAMIIEIDPLPSADAGFDQNVCKDASSVSLSGFVKNAGGGFWMTSGDGTFTNDDTLVTSYIPSDSDKLSGSVTLTLQTSENGACNYTQDFIEIKFTDIPTVKASAPAAICADANEVQLGGAITVAAGGVWSSSGDGSFSPSVNSLNAKYAPGPSDKTNGSVLIKLRSTGNGNCKQYSDSLIINIQPTPVADAGSNFSICADTIGVKLSGVVNNAGGGTWSTGSGTGTFLPDASDLNATFVPSESQIINGKATLTLTTTGNGVCSSRNDVLVITINKKPVIEAGTDLSVCTGLPSIDINGTVANAGGLIWSGGLGTFDNAATASTKYNPAVAENTAGNTVSLYVTSTDNGICKPVRDTLRITFSALPPIDAGDDKTICDSDLPVSLEGNGSPGEWVGGLGTFYPSRNSLNAIYVPDPSELTAQSVKLFLQTVNNGLCAAGIDSVTISFIPGPEVEAGNSLQICANEDTIQLNGIVSTTPAVIWSTDGSGYFDNPNSPNAKYIFTEEDVASGNVLLKLTSPAFGFCKDIADTLRITFSPAPQINAGPDQAVCGTIPVIQLQGNYSIATEAGWTKIDGTGAFSDSLLTNTEYTPSDADRSAGSIRLAYITTIHGSCKPESDTLTITFTDGPSADAGSDLTICADSAYVQLQGSVNAAQGGEWTSDGTGTFSPNPFAQNAVYRLSADDATRSSVTLRLTTTGTGDCPAEYNEMQIHITPAPTIEAGDNLSICKDVLNIPLASNFTVGSGVKWSSSGTGSFNGELLQNTQYVPSDLDKTNGSVLISVQTTGNGLCKAVTDKFRIDFTPIPEVDAGYPQTVCENTGAVALEASIKVATGVTWSSVGNPGGFSDPNTLSTTYNPSLSDYSNGTVLLTVTSTGNGTCQPVSDTVRLFFTPAPTINAGNNITACADTSGLNLNAAITVSSGVLWSTNGSGIFTTSNSSLNPIYIPSVSDTAIRNVVLKVRTTGNGDCNAVEDSLSITFNPAPYVIAGTDIEFCKEYDQIDLYGAVYNATNSSWSSTGNGTFTDNSNPLTGYNITEQDKLKGGVVLKLTATAPGCKTYSDFVNLGRYPVYDIEIIAGQDRSLCSDAETIELAGSRKNSGSVWRTINGTGVISDSLNSNTTYKFSPADIATQNILFTLSSTDHGKCRMISDTFLVSLTPIPTVFAGNDTVVCGDINAVPLNGLVTVAKGGEWTGSGSGYFSAAASELDASYVPSELDVKNGKVFLTLSSTGNGSCKVYKDQMMITLTPPPSVDAGPEQSVCADAERVYLNGKFSVAGGVLWSSSGTGGFSSLIDPTAYYIPSPEDTVNKIITLTLTTTNNGKCKENKSITKLHFTPKPEADAGPSLLVCDNISGINLSGVVKVAGGATWSTLGSGEFSPSSNNLQVTYSPSEKDRTDGSVLLKLTTTDNGKCKPVTDTLEISFAPAPKVEVASVANCIYDAGAQLSAVFNNAGGVQWSTSGTGTFSPNEFGPNVVYHPSEQDFETQNITITIISTTNGVCDPATAVSGVVVSELPKADAGDPKFVCENTLTTLVAKSTENLSYRWFNSLGDTLSTTAVVSLQADKDSSLVLKVTDGKGCFAFDTAQIYTVQRPALNLPDHDCFEPGLILSANPQNLPQYPGSFHWFRNSTLLNGREMENLLVQSAGIYKISYTVGDCITSDSTEVSNPPALITPSKTVCANSLTTISTSDYPDYSYTWKNTNGNLLSNSKDAIVVAMADTNKYIVTVIDTKGCSTRDSMFLIGVKKPDPFIRDSSLCEGAAVVLDGTPKNLTADNYNISYSWFKNDKPAGNTPSITATETGQYKVLINIDYCTGIDSFNLYFNPTVKSSLPDKMIFCENNETASLDAGPGTTYFWHNTGEKSQVIQVYQPDDYIVTVTNEFGCKLTDTVSVLSKCPPTVFVPDAFYPDGNPEDKYFIIFGKYFKNFRLTIYNRWGEIIFYTEDPKVGWDGTYLGKPMPTGIYPYRLSYEAEHEEYNKKYEDSGSVTIVR